jgi:hypothetical protein
VRESAAGMSVCVCVRVSVCVSLCGVTLINGTHILDGLEHGLNPKP